MQKLCAAGVRAWFDEWEIKLGDSIPSKIRQGLEQSRILILANDQNAFSSEWIALFRDPDNSERRRIEEINSTFARAGKSSVRAGNFCIRLSSFSA
jgi:hypothetical protein